MTINELLHAAEVSVVMLQTISLTSPHATIALAGASAAIALAQKAIDSGIFDKDQTFDILTLGDEHAKAMADLQKELGL